MPCLAIPRSSPPTGASTRWPSSAAATPHPSPHSPEPKRTHPQRGGPLQPSSDNQGSAAPGGGALKRYGPIAAIVAVIAIIAGEIGRASCRERGCQNV